MLGQVFRRDVRGLLWSHHARALEHTRNLGNDPRLELRKNGPRELGRRLQELVHLLRPRLPDRVSVHGLETAEQPLLDIQVVTFECVPRRPACGVDDMENGALEERLLGRKVQVEAPWRERPAARARSSTDVFLNPNRANTPTAASKIAARRWPLASEESLKVSSQLAGPLGRPSGMRPP